MRSFLEELFWATCIGIIGGLLVYLWLVGHTN